MKLKSKNVESYYLNTWNQIWIKINKKICYKVWNETWNNNIWKQFRQDTSDNIEKEISEYESNYNRKTSTLKKWFVNNFLAITEEVFEYEIK